MLRDAGLKEVADRGVWVAREGRDRRRTLRERGCGVDDGNWLLAWAILLVSSSVEWCCLSCFPFFWSDL